MGPTKPVLSTQTAVALGSSLGLQSKTFKLAMLKIEPGTFCISSMCLSPLLASSQVSKLFLVHLDSGLPIMEVPSCAAIPTLKLLQSNGECDLGGAYTRRLITKISPAIVCRGGTSDAILELVSWISCA